ncbi:MAG: LptF/LptG family permease, partial [Pseudomonadota bacterium]
GRVVEADGNTLLVMTNGSVQRLERADNELSVVAFDAYAFDLTDLTSGDVTTVFRPSERTLWELLTPDPDDTYRAEREARFQIELHDRLSQPLAPFVYALVVFLFVGDPRMHRQGRLAGVIAAGLSVAAVRGATYGTLLASEGAPILAPLVYVLLLAVAGGALFLILTDRSITIHEQISESLKAAAARFFETPAGATR